MDDSITLIHISDLHVGSNGFDAAWEILSNHLKLMRPALVLVTGDLVDSPDKTLYEKARRCLDSLQVEHIVCPGNHDRHYLGNALGRILCRLRDRIWHTDSLFDKTFSERIAGPRCQNKALQTSGSHSWTLRMISRCPRFVHI